MTDDPAFPFDLIPNMRLPMPSQAGDPRAIRLIVNHRSTWAHIPEESHYRAAVRAMPHLRGLMRLIAKEAYAMGREDTQCALRQALGLGDVLSDVAELRSAVENTE